MSSPFQSEIAKAIADQLQAKLSPNERKPSSSRLPKTWRLSTFTAGRSLFSLRRVSARLSDLDMDKAIELLDEAVKRDPSFFDAYCQLASRTNTIYAVGV